MPLLIPLAQSRAKSRRPTMQWLGFCMAQFVTLIQRSGNIIAILIKYSVRNTNDEAQVHRERPSRYTL